MKNPESFARLLRDQIDAEIETRTPNRPRRSANSVGFDDLLKAARDPEKAPIELLARIATDEWSRRFFAGLYNELHPIVIEDTPAPALNAREVLGSGEWSPQWAGHLSNYLNAKVLNALLLPSGKVRGEKTKVRGEKAVDPDTWRGEETLSSKAKDHPAVAALARFPSRDFPAFFDLEGTFHVHLENLPEDDLDLIVSLKWAEKSMTLGRGHVQEGKLIFSTPLALQRNMVLPRAALGLHRMVESANI